MKELKDFLFPFRQQDEIRGMKVAVLQ